MESHCLFSRCCFEKWYSKRCIVYKARIFVNNTWIADDISLRDSISSLAVITWEMIHLMLAILDMGVTSEGLAVVDWGVTSEELAVVDWDVTSEGLAVVDCAILRLAVVDWEMVRPSTGAVIKR